jgi:hypothetical protein
MKTARLKTKSNPGGKRSASRTTGRAIANAGIVLGEVVCQACLPNRGARDSRLSGSEQTAGFLKREFGATTKAFVESPQGAI